MDADLDAFANKTFGAGKVHNDFMTITTGNGGIHAAKIAFGQYVGIPEVPFGSIPTAKRPSRTSSTSIITCAQYLDIWQDELRTPGNL